MPTRFYKSKWDNVWSLGSSTNEIESEVESEETLIGESATMTHGDIETRPNLPSGRMDTSYVTSESTNADSPEVSDTSIEPYPNLKIETEKYGSGKPKRWKIRGTIARNQR